MPRLAASFRLALSLAVAAAAGAPLGVLVGGCDHVERSNSDPARETWSSAGESIRARATELRTRQQALAGRINALKVPDGAQDLGLQSAIDALKGQLDGLDRAVAEAERALAQTTANVEVALSKPNKLVAKQTVDTGLAAFATAEADAQRALDAVTPQVGNAEAMMQRLLDAQAADRRRLDNLATAPGSTDLADIQFKPGTAELDVTTPTSKGALDRVVAFAGACDALRFTLTGHVARGGTPAAAKSLSLARAEALRTYLTGAGVAAAKIAGVDGAGATRPAIEEPEPGSPAEAAMDPAERESRRARNQRITLTVTAPCTTTTATPPATPPPGGAGAPTPTPEQAPAGAAEQRVPPQPVSPTRPVRGTAPAGGRVMAPGTAPAGGTAPSGGAPVR